MFAQLFAQLAFGGVDIKQKKIEQSSAPSKGAFSRVWLCLCL